MRAALLAGLCALFSIACSDGDATERHRLQEPTGGPESAETAAAPCDWIEHWRTDIDQDTPCQWGMRSRDTTIVLFRSLSGTCLIPATICGEPACAELAEVRERSPVELWGPPDLDPETVWSAAEWFACE